MSQLYSHKGFAVTQPLTDREREVLKAIEANPRLIQLDHWDIFMEILDKSNNAGIGKARHGLIRTYEVILINAGKLSKE